MVSNSGKGAKFIKHPTTELAIMWSKKDIYSFLNELNFNDRENSIVQLIPVLKKDEEIAAKLNLSASAIHYHRINIYRKTGSHDRCDLLIFLLKKGLPGSYFADLDELIEQKQ